MTIRIKSVLAAAVMMAMVCAQFALLPSTTFAASLTSLSDTMSREKISTNSSHVIRFTTPTAINNSGNTIVITFPSDFDFTSIAIGDITFTHGASTGAENTEVLASSPTASSWGAAFSGTNRVLTLTAPTDGVGAAAVAASDKIIITYASTHSVNPTTSGSKSITIVTTTGSGSTGSDSGTLAVPIVAGTSSDDQVVVTAAVAPTITFTNDDDTVGFGNLVTANARYATGDTLGSGSDSTANTLAIATNAPSGYTLTYTGTTLTDAASDTIPVATITSSATGTPGTSQFALDGAMTGSGTMASGYNHANPDWKLVTGTTTALASSTGVTSGDSIAMHYIANTSATQSAGQYSSTITYVATGNF